MLSVVIRSIISAGRAQDSVSIWSSGHATSAGPENALSTEERMGSHGLLHIIQGWIFVFFFFLTNSRLHVVPPFLMSFLGMQRCLSISLKRFIR